MAKRASGTTVFSDRADSYLTLAQRPLHVLLFLLPIIVLYEAGTFLYLTDNRRGIVETIRAHSIILGFFQDFGVAGRFLPAMALVAVLLVWQSIRRDPWRVRPVILAAMLVESIVWTAPLFVFGGLIRRAAAAGGSVDWAAMAWEARLTIALGAGLYEELLFRMIGMAAVHLVMVDLLRMKDATGRWTAVGVTAVAFAFYHEVAGPGPAGVDWSLLALFLGAGVYFGWLYLWRGFGIVVGVHVLYDALVLVALPALRAP